MTARALLAASSTFRYVLGVIATVLGVIVGGPLGMIGTVRAVIAVLLQMGDTGMAGGFVAALFAATGLAAGSFAGGILAHGLVAHPLTGRRIPVVRVVVLGVVAPIVFAFCAPLTFFFLGTFMRM